MTNHNKQLLNCTAVEIFIGKPKAASSSLSMILPPHKAVEKEKGSIFIAPGM